MYLYKSKTLINGVFFSRESIVGNKSKTEAEQMKRLYFKRELKHYKKYSLLWYFRDTRVFSENGTYYIVEENQKTEIDPTDKDYERFQREYNYYVLFDYENSYMYTINTTGDATSINKTVLKQLLGINEIEVLNEISPVDFLKQMTSKHMRLQHTKKKQLTLFGENEYEKLLEAGIYDMFGGNNIRIDFDIENRAIFEKNGIDGIMNLQKEGVKFYVEGVDDHNNVVKVTNDKTMVSEKFGDIAIENLKPKEIFDYLVEYIKNE